MTYLSHSLFAFIVLLLFDSFGWDSLVGFPPTSQKTGLKWKEYIKNYYHLGFSVKIMSEL